ncbi:MAG: NUDIX hydrolase [Anaerolineae bacterium]|nr:MAG: NUDIX hydrolase [Anaerolineae bacterium]
MAGKHIPHHILAVDALVINQNGDVLMIDSPKRGWEFPGGQIEPGESISQAIRREVLEEARVDVKVERLIGIFHNVRANLVVIGLLCSHVSGEPGPSDESNNSEWVPREEVLTRPDSEFIHDRLKEMLDYEEKSVYQAYQNDPGGPDGYRLLESFDL